MPPKKAKNNCRFLLWLALLVTIALPSLAPKPAMAYDFIPVQQLEKLWMDGKGNVCPGPGLTRRIMPCIKETIVSATYAVMVPFATYMKWTVSLMIVLAVTLLGLLILSGRTSAMHRDALVLAIKVGAIWGFVTTFDTVYPAMLDIMEYLCYIVSGYVLNASYFSYNEVCWVDGTMQDTYMLWVWDTVDCALNTLVGGIFNTTTIGMGLIGFLVSCIFSNALGFSIGLMGIYLILQFLWAIFRALYIFLSSYIGLSIMAIVSPIFIPMLLFRATKAYFAKWLRITCSFIMQPMFLFAYLAMLMAAYETIVYTGKYSLYYNIAGNNALEPGFDMPWSEGGWGGIGGWMLWNGMYSEGELGEQGINIDARSLRRAGLLPSDARQTGVMGPMSQIVLDSAQRRQMGVWNMLGVGNGGGDMRFIKTSLPIKTIDWERLALWNGFSDWDPDVDEYSIDTGAYLLHLALCMLMALLIGYILLTLLDFLPFIGAGIAMGSGTVEEQLRNLSPLGAGRMAPPGNEFMRRPLNWHPNPVGGG